MNWFVWQVGHRYAWFAWHGDWFKYGDSYRLRTAVTNALAAVELLKEDDLVRRS